MKKEIMDSFVKYVRRIGEPVQYENWSDSFARKEIKTATMNFLNEIKEYVDFNNLTVEEALSLGFGNWDDELYLIPLYLLPIIPVGIKLTSIMDEEIIYDGKNIDIVNRAGCLAYGIKIKNN